MVARTGGYYGTAFQGFRGVTQGDPLSPTILNVVVDTVVQHWVAVVVERSGVQDGHGWEGRHQIALLYIDDGMVVSSDPGCLQGSFNTLLGLFCQVGLQTNVRKMVRMVCCTCQAAGTQSEAEYKQCMTGAGLAYRWRRQRFRVQCSECG